MEKRRLQIERNLVDLPHVADAERGENGKDRKQNSQHLADTLHAFFTAETVRKIVHCAAGPLTVRIAAAEIDAEHIFGIVRHHAEERRNPHPEHRTRAADHDGGGNTGDVAGADGRSQRRTERLKLRDRLFVRLGSGVAFAEQTANGHLPPVPQMRDLEHTRGKRHDDAGADQQYKADLDPHESVDRVVDLCQFVKELFHVVFPSCLLFCRKIKRDRCKTHRSRKKTTETSIM